MNPVYLSRFLSAFTTTVTRSSASSLGTGDRMWSSFPHMRPMATITHDTHQYFMKASPVRPGDFIEFFAEIDLLGELSTCPGDDCSTKHSRDTAPCYP